jgi:hypothetical protein
MFLVGAVVLGLGSNVAWAYGFGFGVANWVPNPGDFVNQHAASRFGRAARPASNDVYGGNPNSYLNRIRDNGFVPSYDPRRRTRTGEQANRPVSPGQLQAVASPVPIVNPGGALVPLSSFFNAAQVLVWPSTAPVGGDLQQKREISDAGALVVLGEYQAQGRATIGSVTDARQKLIAYGQLALADIRANATAPVAETFHTFLLSLYDALGHAASTQALASATSR